MHNFFRLVFILNTSLNMVYIIHYKTHLNFIIQHLQTLELNQVP